MAAAAFQAASLFGEKSAFFKNNLHFGVDCGAASKGGCSHDWLPHTSQSDKHAVPAGSRSTGALVVSLETAICDANPPPGLRSRHARRAVADSAAGRRTLPF